MAASSIEQRIDALEREVRILRGAKKSKRQKAWWERLGGEFKDDPLFDEIVKAGKRYRRSTRPRSK